MTRPILLDGDGKQEKSVGSVMRQMEIDLANAKLANVGLYNMIKQLEQQVIMQMSYNGEVDKRAFKKLGIDVEAIAKEIELEQKQSPETSDQDAQAQAAVESHEQKE